MGTENLIAPLRKVKITDFRGIRELTLDLHQNVTVLFGANAAGKTTILDAISIGLGAYISRIPKATRRDFAKSGDIRVPWKDNRDAGEKQGVEKPFARVELEAVDGLAWDVSRYRSLQDRQAAPAGRGAKELMSRVDIFVRDYLEGGIRTDHEDDLYMLPPPLPLVAAYGNERAVVEVPLRERGFQKDFHPLGALDGSLKATTRFRTVFEWFRVMEEIELRERDKRRNFDYRLPELEWVRRAVEKAELRCHDPRVETRPIRMLVDFDTGGGERQAIDIRSLSDGYRTHFALIVDLARRMVQLNPSLNPDDPVRGTNSEAVILIDEIDLHLDPPWQSRVVKGLRSAFPNAQLILTTHSEQVIGSVPAECVRKLTMGDGELLVENVPFAQGATGERILIELMGAKERVPGKHTRLLSNYLRLVETGHGREDDAKRIREELERYLPGDPALHRADLEMARQKLAAEFEEKRG